MLLRTAALSAISLVASLAITSTAFALPLQRSEDDVVVPPSPARTSAPSALDADPWNGRELTSGRLEPLPPNVAPLEADPWAGVVVLRPSRRTNDRIQQEDATSIEPMDGWRTATPQWRRVRPPLTIDLSDPWSP